MKKILTLLAVSTAAFTPLQNASAHIGYSGRNLGAWSEGGGVWSVVGNSGTLANGSVVISLLNIASDFGWADATDSDYGDSHKGRWFSFSLNNPGKFSLSILGGGTNSNTQAGTNPYDTNLGPQFLPGFTLYRGLAVASAHDSSVVSVAWRANRSAASEGSLNTLGSFSIGNDSNEIGELVYVGHAVDGTTTHFGFATGIQGDGVAEGTVTQNFDLTAGSYSVFVGGANSNGVDAGNYGATVTFGVVPEPSAYALLGCMGFIFALLNLRLKSV